MIEAPLANAETLAVSGNETELSHLRELFAGSGWSIHTAHTLAEAKEWLTRHPTPVVLCEACLPDGDWEAGLRMAEGLTEPPYIVPMSRQADERLWVEVLNRGGYDLVALPAKRADLFGTLSSAWRAWKARCRRHSAVEPLGAAAR